MKAGVNISKSKLKYRLSFPKFITLGKTKTSIPPTKNSSIR